MYQGHGGASRAREIDLARLDPLLARGLEATIGGDAVPLVLAADVRHRPGLEAKLRRDVGLIPAQLEGNTEHRSPAALHSATWPLIEGLSVNIAAERQSAARGRALLTDVAEIAAHAVMGRIRTFWVPALGGLPGCVDPVRGRLAEGWGDDDLIESLCVQVLRRAGGVRLVEDVDAGSHPGALAAEIR